MSDIDNVANQIEAILIASPEPLSKGEISARLNTDIKEVSKALKHLEKRYQGTALEVKNYGKKYKIVVREEYSELAYRYSELELTKGELEILAYIFRNKKVYLTQIRRLRGPKAIEEISHLEKIGYVKLEKSGRYNVLKLTRLFMKKFGKELEKALKENGIQSRIENIKPENQNEIQQEKNQESKNEQWGENS